MSNKLITLEEAVRRYSHDGMQYASGAALPVGSDAIVFGRELLRQRRRAYQHSRQLWLLRARRREAATPPLRRSSGVLQMWRARVRQRHRRPRVH